MIKKLLLSSFLLLITACGTSIESLEPKFSQLKTGDSKQKTIELLGEPIKSESSSILGVNKSTLEWGDLEKHYQIDFIAETVMTKETKSR